MSNDQRQRVEQVVFPQQQLMVVGTHRVRNIRQWLRVIQNIPVPAFLDLTVFVHSQPCPWGELLDARKEGEWRRRGVERQIVIKCLLIDTTLLLVVLQQRLDFGCESD